MKPGDFLLGVLDFFAVLLPGSLATWLALQYASASEVRRLLAVGLDEVPPQPDRLALGIAWLVASYVLGHFVAMIGSRLDFLYDVWRERRPHSADVLYLAANEVRSRRTPSIALPPGRPGFSTLKWARAFIQIRQPAARQEIDRLEADSKFFRSLVVVSVAAAAHGFWQSHPRAGLAGLAIAGVSAYRFADLRWKMTELSYATAVILDATTPSSAPDPEHLVD